MRTTRRRRIVRRAVMALGAVVLLFAGWLMLGEPPEIARSRGIKLGMYPIEVDAVMQAEAVSGLRLPDGRELRSYGAVGHRKARLTHTLNQWMGTSISTSYTDYPVRVRFDMKWRVDRIERGDEVEEAPPRQQLACRSSRGIFKVSHYRIFHVLVLVESRLMSWSNLRP